MMETGKREQLVTPEKVHEEVSDFLKKALDSMEAVVKEYAPLLKEDPVRRIFLPEEIRTALERAERQEDYIRMAKQVRPDEISDAEVIAALENIRRPSEEQITANNPEQSLGDPRADWRSFTSKDLNRKASLLTSLNAITSEEGKDEDEEFIDAVVSASDGDRSLANAINLLVSGNMDLTKGVSELERYIEDKMPLSGNVENINDPDVKATIEAATKILDMKKQVQDKTYELVERYVYTIKNKTLQDNGTTSLDYIVG